MEDVMAETLRTTADKLVAHCRAGTTKQGLDELYDPAAVSVEATPMTGTDSAETKGVEGIRGKHDWWENAMEVHSASAEGPFMHGDDRFAVIFAFDATDKNTGKRNQMREVAIYTVNPGGKIVREEFYYDA
jgi:ketosteroid isomerase-like protein